MTDAADLFHCHHCGAGSTGSWICQTCGEPPAVLADSDRWRTCIHESAHACVGILAGQTPRIVSIEPGRRYRGMNLRAPRPKAKPTAQSAVSRLSIADADWYLAAMVVSLAGPIVDQLFHSASGYHAPSALAESEEAYALRAAVARAALPDDERAMLDGAKASDEPVSDWEAAIRDARRLAGDDETVVVHAQMALADALAKRFIFMLVRPIELVAIELDRHTSLRGVQIEPLVGWRRAVLL